MAILGFSLAGLSTHDGAWSGVLRVAWPFLAVLLVVHVVAPSSMSRVRAWPFGVVLWVLVTAGGLALRGLTGGGTAFAFMAVTAGVLALLLIGWRLVAALLTRGRQR